MSKILRDYKCEEHGYFEGYRAECPHTHCEAEVYVVLLKAPGIISDRTKGADATLAGLAKEFGMTDIKSTREGEHQDGFFTRNNQGKPADEPPEPRPRDAAIWGGTGGLSMKSVLNGAIKPVRDEPVSINPNANGKLSGPKTASYMADHQNLNLDP